MLMMMMLGGRGLRGEVGDWGTGCKKCWVSYNSSSMVLGGEEMHARATIRSRKTLFFNVTPDVGRTFFEGFDTCHTATLVSKCMDRYVSLKKHRDEVHGLRCTSTIALSVRASAKQSGSGCEQREPFGRLWYRHVSHPLVTIAQTDQACSHGDLGFPRNTTPCPPSRGDFLVRSSTACIAEPLARHPPHHLQAETGKSRRDPFF